MISDLLHRIASAPDEVVVLVAALFAMLEASAFVGLVVPGETIVLLAGAVTATDGPPVLVVIAAVTVASVAGDSLGYLLGRSVGPRLRSSGPGRWIGTSRWAAADAAMAHAGGRTVALARFVGIAHAVTPAVAGMGGMRYRRFLLASVSGSSLWATAYVVVGRVTGGSWERLDGRLRIAIPLVAAVVVLGSLLGLWRRSGRRPVPVVVEAPPVAELSRRSVVHALSTPALAVDLRLAPERPGDGGAADGVDVCWCEAEERCGDQPVASAC